MSAAKPGWYPDPAADRPDGAPGYRWWDGTQWTDATGASADAEHPWRGSAAAPEASRSLPGPEQTGHTGTARTATNQAGIAQTSADQAGIAQTSADQAGIAQTSAEQAGIAQTSAEQAGIAQPVIAESDTAKARTPLGTDARGDTARGRTSPGGAARIASRWTLLLALAATVAMVAGLIVWREPADRRADAPADAAARAASTAARSAPRPVGRLDRVTRRASLGSASLILPEDPYVLYEEPMRIPGLIDELFQANAAVHVRYDWNRDWSAVVGLAAINASRTEAADLDQAAANALRRFAQAFFGGRPTTVRRLRTSDHAVDGRPGVRLTAEVHYRLPALASSYDVVTAVLVRLDDGTVVAAFSSIPDDAPAEYTTLAQESLATLSVG